MTDFKQMKDLVASTLAPINLNYGSSINLVFGTGLQESNYSYLKQSNGPALSFWQIEPITYKDICNRINMDIVLYTKCLNLLNMPSFPYDPNALIGNMSLAIIICRLKYYFNKQPLPNNSALDLAAYYKSIYNSPLGAATIEQATKNFQVAIAT